MKMKVFAIKDRALNAFMQPFFMHTEGQAIRAFQDNINDEKSAAHAHPDDYDLWVLAEFEDSDGRFSHTLQIGHGRDDQVSMPRQLVLGKQVKEMK